ncbi:MAG: hypothetical protein ACRDD1_20285, partial [Planctomycetia bacterium]
WRNAEAGTADGVAVLRFRHDDDAWQAEVVYIIREAAPWIELSTIIRNRSQQRTLEVPLVDLITGRDLKITREKRGELVASQGADGPTVIALPIKATGVVDEVDDGRWALQWQANDPEPSMAQRVGGRLMRFGQSSTHSPIPASRVDGAFRDRDHWHRLAPGAERTVQRRLLWAADPAAAVSMVEYASRESAPPVQVVGQGKPGAAKPGLFPKGAPTAAAVAAEVTTDKKPAGRRTGLPPVGTSTVARPKPATVGAPAPIASKVDGRPVAAREPAAMPRRIQGTLRTDRATRPSFARSPDSAATTTATGDPLDLPEPLDVESALSLEPVPADEPFNPAAARPILPRDAVAPPLGTAVKPKAPPGPPTKLPSMIYEIESLPPPE